MVNVIVMMVLYLTSSNTHGHANNTTIEFNNSLSKTIDTGFYLHSLLVLVGICLIIMLMACYLHKNEIKDQRNISIEVYTTDTHAMECFERLADDQIHQEEVMSPISFSPCHRVTSTPPPAYDSLIFDRFLPSPNDKKKESNDPDSIISPCIISLPMGLSRDDQELPSYEAALRLKAEGFI